MNDIIINSNKVVVNKITTPPHNGKPKNGTHFKRCVKIGKLRFYITWNYRLKNSQSRDNKDSDFDHNKAVRTKEIAWERSNHRCEMCGKEIGKFKYGQMHHVLPWWRFREFEFDERNVLLLCNDCHKSIHVDPFLNGKMMVDKAKELGIDLKEYYDGLRC